MHARIAGTGFYVPPRVVTNAELTQLFDTSHEWIVERTGIHERHWIDFDTPTGPADLAYEATQMALAQAGLAATDLDCIVFATLSPEAWFPGAGVFLQAKLGVPYIPAFDVRMQCSGFLYALQMSEHFVKLGTYRHVLVVGAEVQSTTLDFSPQGRTVGVIFGDGAGVAIVGPSDRPGILNTHLHADGRYAKELWVPEPTSTRRPKVTLEGERPGEGLFAIMNGREVFRHAVTRMSEVITHALSKQGWAADAIDLFVLHQANIRIVQAVAEGLGLPFERFFNNIDRYGNTTAASIPICLAEAERAGRLAEGHKVVLASFGSGFGWGAATLVW